MKKIKRFAVFAGLAVLSLIFVLSLAIGRPARATGAMQPFHAVVYVTTSATPGACSITNEEIGSGLAYHLGKITVNDEETAQLPQPDCSPFGGTLTVHGTFTMVAANGDQLRGEYTTEAALNPENGEVDAEGDFAFTSGTGRFRNVSGFGRLTAYGAITDPVTFAGVAYGTYDGFIKYGGPQR